MKGQPVKQHNQNVGKWGEDRAAEFLEKQGYRIEARNVRTPEGEIDLLAVKEQTLVFVEVKTRTHHQDGYPEEAVTDEKLEHMVNSAEHYLMEHTEFEEHWRIDVIAVTGKINDPNPQIEWFEDAV